MARSFGVLFFSVSSFRAIITVSPTPSGETMPTSETFIHRTLLKPDIVAMIKEITGWTVDGSWDVSSRRWRRSLGYHNARYANKGNGGDNLITVLHYGKRAVVFLDKNPLSFTNRYIASDFNGPSTLASRDKYELFDDHFAHKGHCKKCRP